MESHLLRCTVSDDNKFKKLLNKLLDSEREVAFDTETTGLCIYGHDVPIGLGLYFPKSDIGFYLVELESGFDYFLAILNKMKDKKIKLIGHNIAFDFLACLSFCQKNGVSLDFKENDVVDTMHFAVLADNTTQVKKLEEIAKLFGFQVPYQEAMREWLFMNGYEDKHVVSAAPLDLQKEYCIEDCMLTYKVYERFLK